MSDDLPDYAWNYQMDSAFITGRTAHLVRDVDGFFVTSKCGVEFHCEHRERHDFGDENTVADRHKCGRCPWGEIGE